jgi:hypothetical protein
MNAASDHIRITSKPGTGGATTRKATAKLFSQRPQRTSEARGEHVPLITNPGFASVVIEYFLTTKENPGFVFTGTCSLPRWSSAISARTVVVAVLVLVPVAASVVSVVLSTGGLDNV